MFTGLRSGTPIAITPEALQQHQQQQQAQQQQQQQQQQTSQQQQQAQTATSAASATSATSLAQQLYRFQTVNGQIMSIPASKS